MLGYNDQAPSNNSTIMKKAKTAAAKPEKRSAQMIKIEKMYGRNFGVKNDEKLWNHLNKIGLNSLSELLRYDKK
ncbi:MAG: hypothetical protein AAB373_00455 [Patescibacteria group bacterium]